MPWKCVAFLGIVLTVANAQVNSIDKDILNPGTTSTASPTSHKSNNLLDTDLNDEDNITDADSTTTTQQLTPVTTAFNIITNEPQISTIVTAATEQIERNEDDSVNNGDNDDNNGDGETAPDVTDENEGTEDSNQTDQNNNESETIENGNEGEQEIPENTDEDIPNSNENGGEESNENDNTNPREIFSSRSEEVGSREAVGEPIVTEGGLVQGYNLHGDSGIRSYIDIHYGTVTEMFQAPEKPAPWGNVHTIVTHQKRCPQIDEGGDYAGEIDCLTLSVFTPSNVENAAVLFHIHDGNFHTGSANPSIYGPEYLVTKGIILVLPNYRVGALGFLCMKNEIAPGNAGLKDLALALEWTKKNIANFGGDSSKITVSGDGRSGALAGYLAMSPVSRPHISGVITESGSMLAHWAIDRNPEVTASLLQEAIETNITNEIDLQTIVTSSKDINFRPCVESGTSAFLNETPWEIMQNKDKPIEIPFMMGSANHAGLQEAMIHTQESLNQLNENFSIFLPDDLEFKNGEEKEVAESIKEQYFGDKTIDIDQTVNISLCYTDAYYLGPAIRASRLLVESGAKVYFYEFSFVGELNRILSSLSSTVLGAARGDLVSYTFTQDGDVPAEGTAEERLVNILTDLWISFMQTGIPSAEGIEWKGLESVTETEEQYLSIDSEMVLRTGLHVDRIALWTDVYKNYFIERNLAVTIGSSIYLTVIAILLFCFY